MLVSPVSFLVVLPFGVQPGVWLGFWVRYVFIFIVAALVVAVAGFASSSSAWVRAERLEKESKQR